MARSSWPEIRKSGRNSSGVLWPCGFPHNGALCGGVPTLNAHQHPARNVSESKTPRGPRDPDSMHPSWTGSHHSAFSTVGQAGMRARSCRSSNYSKEIGNTYFYVKSSLGSHVLKAKLKPNASAANRELFVPPRVTL